MDIKNITFSATRLLLFGGTYSNLEALMQLQVIAQKEKISPDHIINTGDIVGYCADAEQCIKSIHSWGIHSIKGNVEEQLITGSSDCGCNFEEGSTCDQLSNNWYAYAQKSISPSSLLWLKTLPDYLTFSFNDTSFTVVHGGYSNISKFIFASTSWEKKTKELSLAKSSAIIAGHSGLPFSQKKDNNYWINPGVIGMPANDGTQRVWYAILSCIGEVIHIEHKSFTISPEKTIEKMKKHHLPTEYQNTLRTGIWDNCDILPENETSLQGKKINFNKKYL